MKAIERSARPWAKLVVAASLGLLGSCAAPPPPAPPPAPAPVPMPTIPAPLPPPAPAANWRDLPITPGTWRWGMVDGRSTALFGPAGAAPLASLTCDKPAGRVLLARAGSGPGHVPMAVTTTFGTRPLLSEPLVSPAGWLTVPLHATDPILDSIAFSRGRFALDAAGLEPLLLPSWPEIARVIEDCRRS